jgi:uncharacterized protein (TIGR00369 family)
MSSTRFRTVTWDDPTPTRVLGASRDGLSLLQAMVAGELPPPPVARLLGMELRAVDEGRAEFALPPAEEQLNPLGTVHGGVITTILDSAMGCAVHTTLPAGMTYTTLELKVNFVRPVLLGSGPVVAEGTVVHRGSTVVTAEGRLVREDDGKLVAHASSTLLVMPAAARRAEAA